MRSAGPPRSRGPENDASWRNSKRWSNDCWRLAIFERTATELVTVAAILVEIGQVLGYILAAATAVVELSVAFGFEN
ncbi:hypothetical protein ACFX2I_045004 [Malus domestica]